MFSPFFGSCCGDTGIILFSGYVFESGVYALDKKPRRRLMHILSGQGIQANQQITFLSDGADNVRDLQYMMYPES
ncbi:TPA: hypothetical protein JBK30_08580 [Legionella pneumophila]|nr:hypothetical protein [Legionella pneumophila]